MRKLTKKRRLSYEPLLVKAYHDEGPLHNAYHDAAYLGISVTGAGLSTYAPTRPAGIAISIGKDYLPDSFYDAVGHAGEAVGNANVVDPYQADLNLRAQEMQNAIDGGAYASQVASDAMNAIAEYAGDAWDSLQDSNNNGGGGYNPSDYNSH